MPKNNFKDAEDLTAEIRLLREQLAEANRVTRKREKALREETKAHDTTKKEFVEHKILHLGTPSHASANIRIEQLMAPKDAEIAKLESERDRAWAAHLAQLAPLPAHHLADQRLAYLTHHALWISAYLLAHRRRHERADLAAVIEALDLSVVAVTRDATNNPGPVTGPEWEVIQVTATKKGARVAIDDRSMYARLQRAEVEVATEADELARIANEIDLTPDEIAMTRRAEADAIEVARIEECARKVAIEALLAEPSTDEIPEKP